MPGIARKITQFKKKEIDYLFAHARRIFRSSSFLILMSPRQSDFARILVIASRKVGNSVVRNKIRRRIKSIFYEQCFFNGKYDWVIITYPKVKFLSFAELENTLIKVEQGVRFDGQ